MMVTQETQGFLDRSGLQRKIALHPVFLYCSWQLMPWLLFVGPVMTSHSSPLGVPLSLILYARGRGYKEGNRVGCNTIPIRTLSLLAYFTYIFIDTIIYTLGSMS
jgi:hypothetical protein